MMQTEKLVKCVVIGAASTLAAGASGQTIVFDMMVSSDRGVTWTNSVEALSGTSVLAAIFTRIDGDAFGVAGATFRITGTGGVAGDTASFTAGTATGRVNPFDFGASTNAIYTTADGFRIDAASDVGGNDPSRGVTIMQRDPGSGGLANFATGDTWNICFAFEVHLSSSRQFRGLSLSMDELMGGMGTYYSTSSSTRGTRGAVSFDGAVILTGEVPVPGSVAVLAVAGFFAQRRRRI